MVSPCLWRCNGGFAAGSRPATAVQVLRCLSARQAMSTIKTFGAVDQRSLGKLKRCMERAMPNSACYAPTTTRATASQIGGGLPRAACRRRVWATSPSTSIEAAFSRLSPTQGSWPPSPKTSTSCIRSDARPPRRHTRVYWRPDDFNIAWASTLSPERAVAEIPCLHVAVTIDRAARDGNGGTKQRSRTAAGKASRRRQPTSTTVCRRGVGCGLRPVRG